jgi:putative oxidoreductase
MSRPTSFLRAGFLPSSVDLGLLVLRIWVAASLLMLHGVGKADRLFGDNPTFRSVFGLSPVVSLALAVVGEVVAPVFLLVGFAARWAALLSATTMATAFIVAHGSALSGERSGELPFVYLAAMVALFLAGPGRFSVDGRAEKA